MEEILRIMIVGKQANKQKVQLKENPFDFMRDGRVFLMKWERKEHPIQTI